MENIRLFISVSLDPGISKDIQKKFQALNLPWEMLRPVNPEILHLTLKFLGDVPIDKIPACIEALSTIENIDPIELHINKTSIVDPNKPRILRLDFVDSPELQQLYDAIEQALFDAGLAHKEVRKFNPHITLARIKTTAPIEEFKSFSDWKIKKIFTVVNFELQESVLSKKGPEYTVLQTFDI
ncbi:RNA 2',3'-cyclic phosphodiesterase [Candidatus Parcubacteria bacterium]|jgi:RNA 2',3'-cyclic 3'-phosphodiesterase|nr:RNA 2',3'-cyclic phosphodiesterase [Candidatus Parcubacteria bacterium]